MGMVLFWLAILIGALVTGSLLVVVVFTFIRGVE
jgi:hypothetical protein